jgi:glyoxalase superfamily protein
MTCHLFAVSFDARQPLLLARFWAGLLGRTVVEEAGGALVPGDDTQVSLRFVAGRAEKVGPDYLHLHLTSAGLDDQQNKVAQALELGASHLDVGQRPEEGHVVLADPEGNAFDVIEPDNRFLAGCGLLGELACDGSRKVGVFWSAALSWPLVWDQNEETAIQAPQGGTKIAWGGTPRKPGGTRNQQRFDLATPIRGDRTAEIARLVALGATQLNVDEDGAVLADPDGNEFRVLPSR